MKKLIIEDFNEKKLKEFGNLIKVPKKDERKPTLESDFLKYYGGMGFLSCKDLLDFGIITFKKRDFEVEQLEQHTLSNELLFAIDRPFVIPITSNIYNNGEAFPDIKKIKAIRINQGEGIIFKKGIWHWAPFPLSNEEASALVAIRKGTCDDDIFIKKLDTKFLMISR